MNHRFSLARFFHNKRFRVMCPLLFFGLWGLGHPLSAQEQGLARLYSTRYSVDDGLLSFQINQIFQDRDGYLWIATNNGLNRFDGHAFWQNHAHETQHRVNPYLYILDIAEDTRGNLWLATTDGLFRFHKITEQLTPISADFHGGTKSIRRVGVDHRNRIWVIDRTRQVSIYHPETNSSQALETLIGQPIADNPRVECLKIQGEKVWLGTESGMLCWNDRLGRLIDWRTARNYNKPVYDKAVKALTLDAKGGLWVLTDEGVDTFLDKSGYFSSRFLFDRNSQGTDEYHTFAVFDPFTMWVAGRRHLLKIDLLGHPRVAQHYAYQNIHQLTDDRVQSMLIDEAGTIWLGTLFGGLNRIHPDATIETIPLIPAPQAQSNYPSIRAVRVAEDGTLWIGDYDGLLSHHQGQTQFHPERNNPTPPRYHRRVESLLITRKNHLLIGTNQGLFHRESAVVKDQTPGFQRLTDRDGGTLLDKTVLCMIQDAEGFVWAGTAQGGLYEINESLDRVDSVAGPQHPTTRLTGRIHDLVQDKRMNLWLGTNRGLYRRTQPGNISHLNLPVDPERDGRHVTISDLLMNNTTHTLWVATQGNGLFYSQSNGKQFRRIQAEDGLPDNKVQSLCIDRFENLWISTVAGLCKYDPYTEEITTYNFNDGIRPLRLLTNTMVLDPTGSVYVAGTNGLYRFQPGRYRNGPAPIQPRFTSLLLSESNGSRETLKIANTESEDGVDTLVLPARAGHFQLRVSARHIADPALASYEYQMEEDSDVWQPITHPLPVIQFTHQSPGTYPLRVRARYAGNTMSREPTKLRILIVPPLYRSTPALILYAVLLTGIIGAVLIYQRRVAKHHRLMSERLRNLDQTKDRIMSNISKELNTPLQGMIGIAQALVNGNRGNLAPEVRNDLRVLIESGEGLANTVGDIMDFAGLKKQELRFNVTTVNLKFSVDVVLALCKPLLGAKPIKLSNNTPEHYFVSADINRLKQILFNLVENAIKFSKNGVISVAAKENGGWTTVQVSDQGKGIAPKVIDYIFEHFEAVNHTTTTHIHGKGLGLALTKSLVHRHGGDIYVQSKVGVGSTFYFTLPTAVVAADTQGDVYQPQEGAVTPDEESPLLTANRGDERFKILIVDDNPINLQLLVNILGSQDYQIVKAENGFEGLDSLKDNPDIDLILLDIAMPRLSGYDVCLNIRERFGPSQLPVIFLSAVNQTHDIARCFDVGGNDFLAKPVTKIELLARVKTQLDLLDAHRNLEAKIRARTEEVELLAEIGRDLTANLDFAEVAKRLYTQLTLFMDTYAFGIGIHDPETGMIQFSHSLINGKPVKPFDVHVGNPERFSAFCVRQAKTIHINSLDEEGYRYLDREPNPAYYRDIQSILAVPMNDYDQSGPPAKGVIILYTPSAYAYEDRHVPLLEWLAGSTSIALVNHLAFNEIRQQEEEIRRTQSQLVQNEKMAGLGTLAAGVAHEINNPANFVNAGTYNLRTTIEDFQSFLFGLMEDETDEQLEALFLERFNKMKDQLHTIQNGVSRIHGIVKDLRTFSRLDEADMKTVNIHEGLLSTLHLVRTQHKEQVTFEIGFADALYCECWAAELNQVFMNILINGCQAIYARNQADEPGRISIATKTQDDFVWIMFEDNGCGMSAEVRERIFEPFYTTKKSSGTGLGLSISYGIILKHKGSIEVASKPGRGSTFTLKIPLNQHQVTAEALAVNASSANPESMEP